MTGGLPDAFLSVPVAHRAFHDRSARRPENSRAAIRAAMAQGFGIEIDLQLAGDGTALVFHDYALDRLTGRNGVIRQLAAEEAVEIGLLDSDGEGIPTLVEVLDLINGAVPLLIEVKDQDGAMGPNVGTLEAATAAALRDYDGPAALMSFNPHSVADLADRLPHVPRGLVTSSFDPARTALTAARCDALRRIPDIDRTGACFISHEWRDLDRPRVQRLHADGFPILCWTIRSPEEEAEARATADNVTFEDYTAVIPA